MLLLLRFMGNHPISDGIINCNLKSLALPIRRSLLLLSHRETGLNTPEIIPGTSGVTFTAKGSPGRKLRS